MATNLHFHIHLQTDFSIYLFLNCFKFIMSTTKDVKPRRVMSEIQNTIPTSIPEKRRRSLGFEMVSFSKRPSDFESKIPRPVSKSANLLNMRTNISLGQLVTSSLAHSPISSRSTPRDSLTEINRFRNLKHKLSKHLGPQAHSKSDEVILAPPTHNESNRLDSENSQYKREISVLEEHERQLTFEIQALLRDQRKLRRCIENIENDINMYSLRLKREEESHKREIDNNEQLVDTQLGHLALNQDVEYKEIKFSMENEINDAKQYRDEWIVEEIKTIRAEIDILRKDLLRIKESKQLTLKEESAELENEINNFLKDKTEEVDQLSTQFEEKEEEINRVYSEYQELHSKVTDKEQEVARLQETISNIESNMINFASIKSALFKDLSTVDTTLAQVKKQSETYQEIYDKENQKYMTTLRKVEKNEAKRRILENSIFDYQGKIRVYAISESGDVHNNVLAHNNKEYLFNNVTTPNSEVSEEFSCLVLSSITGGCNVSVVFTGVENQNLVTTSILKSYNHLLSRCSSLRNTKSWDFMFHFKSIGLTDEGVVDLLNSETSIDINSLSGRLGQIPAQPMIIDKDPNSKEFKQILTKCNEIPLQAKIHIISIEVTAENKHIECDIMFMDMTGTKMTSQTEILLGFPNELERNGKVGKFLQFAYSRTKCLFIGNLDLKDLETTNFLNVLQKIQNTDSPYQRRN